VGIGGTLLANRQQNKHQAARDEAAAARDYARRADEHYRPHFDTVLVASRSINYACARHSKDLGDVDALDRCIDHLECSPLTRPVAFAATEMRNAAVQFRSELETQDMLNQQMPAQGSGGPLNPTAGTALVEHSNSQLEPAKDAALGSCLAVRNAVKAAVASLEAQQEMSSSIE